MIRSMYSGINGMKNFQTKLDVIGNNIANVNTHGFKKGRVTFKDMVSQTITGASGPAGDKGGINPVQVGLGSQIGAIDTVDTQGSLQTTGRVLDLGIQGDGYFVVAEGTPAGDTFFATSTYFTRAGNFYLNNEGYLVNSSGHYVMAVNPEDNSMMPVQLNGGNVQEVQNLSVSQNGNISFIKTTGLTVAQKAQEIAGKIAATAKNLVEDPTSQRYVDSLMKLRDELSELSTQAVREADLLAIDAQALVDEAAESDDQKTQNDADDAKNKADAALEEANLIVTTFQDLTQAIDAVYSSHESYKLNPDQQAALDALETAAKEALSNANTVQLQTAATSEAVTSAIDAIEYVNAAKLGLVKEGDLYTTVHSIALARFSNPGGLEKVGENLYVSSANTGEANIMVPGDVGAGTMVSGTLEMSNVDLGEEFTEMIVAQRGFQANTRIITTSDEILQELVNLKR